MYLFSFKTYVQTLKYNNLDLFKALTCYLSENRNPKDSFYLSLRLHLQVNSVFLASKPPSSLSLPVERETNLH
ncbi:hypothetical protein L1987_49021 [Smallanthus sonchifolius]|uniref:Uncharacterized protein n=1 Tax=Smallanthus sonchifolius TaxID=185202 RepID=A0ACB9FTL0_9ASTR|nr:hypothetical protein L1987_49021 [Smallanthus sonchifolius]